MLLSSSSNTSSIILITRNDQQSTLDRPVLKFNIGNSDSDITANDVLKRNEITSQLSCIIKIEKKFYLIFRKNVNLMNLSPSKSFKSFRGLNSIKREKSQILDWFPAEACHMSKKLFISKFIITPSAISRDAWEKKIIFEKKNADEERLIN
ncbi:hypothetical protein BpHYR1_025615 [Brachionus plicatilis]|uniref:Uncharacterized protein n=1 Tax=Brachionus plicatilis TaxID=10195 RepID=A0A3M7STT8_BRAPC|nr:hypothetical protein BpHYR1_025615 [Brachionus plicatilis]